MPGQAWFNDARLDGMASAVDTSVQRILTGICESIVAVLTLHSNDIGWCSRCEQHELDQYQRLDGGAHGR